MESGGGSPGPSRWGRAARELLPVLVLLAVSGKSTFDEYRARDLTWTDEALYLACAWHAPDPAAAHLTTSPIYVPLYVAWYRALLWLPVAPEYLPFVSHGALMTALAVLFYALVRRLGTGRWVGATAASVLVLNTQLAVIHPFPVHMATALLAAGVLAGTYQRSVLGACGPVGFGVLAACYARPEFGTLLLAFLPLYLATGLWACLRAAGRRREFLPWAVPLVAAVAACELTLGVPLPDGPRGMFAFSQHYACNVATARGEDPLEATTHFERVIRADFGDVTTVGAAARARPDAVAWHIGQNAQRLPSVGYDLLRPRAPLARKVQRPAHLLVLGVIGIGFAGAVRRAYRDGLSGPGARPLRVVLVALGCVALITGPAVLLVFPRDHYLLLPLFFLLALAVSGLPAPRWPGEPGPKARAAALVAAAAFLVGAAPSARSEWTLLKPLMAKPRPPEPSFEWREAMALLRELPRRPGTVVFEYDYAVRSLLMPMPLVVVCHGDKAEGFRAFVARHRIGVVVLDRRLPADPRFGGDPEFMALWDGTDTGDFVIRCSPGGARIAVRKDLLE